MGDATEADPEILLVEDNPGDVRLIEEALQDTDSTLHITRDGKEALDFLQQRNEFSDATRPDIVLLDLNLPRIDGTRILDETRSDPALDHIRVIVITSARENHTNLDPKDIDEDDLLTKPTDPAEFLTLVRTTVFD